MVEAPFEDYASLAALIHLRAASARPRLLLFGVYVDINFHGQSRLPLLPCRPVRGHFAGRALEYSSLEDHIGYPSGRRKPNSRPVDLGQGFLVSCETEPSNMMAVHNAPPSAIKSGSGLSPRGPLILHH